MLQARCLTKTYLASRALSLREARVTALENVDLSLWPGSTLALAGRSGSGKSTLGRCLALLERPDSGEIWFEGQNALTLGGPRLAAARRNIQLIFQHSATAINPGFTALQTVAEPLTILRRESSSQREEQAIVLMERLGIPADTAHRPAMTFSGGQRQRLVIARALVLCPKVLIFDEALSGLDVRTQAKLTDLLLELQRSLSLSYLFISHDLRIAASLAHTLAILDSGKIVEVGPAKDLICDAHRPETRELLAAIPAMPKVDTLGKGIL